MAVEEGKLAKGLRVNSAVFTNNTSPAPSAVRRAHSYHLHTSSGEHRTSEDLRHTALRNGLTRVNSASKVDTPGVIGRVPHMAPKNKNIPMVAAPPIGRLGENRWGTYSLNQPVNNVLVPERTDIANELKIAQKSSISPLTQIHQSTAVTGDILNREFTKTLNNKTDDLRVEKSSRGSSRSSLRGYRAQEKTGVRFPDKKGEHNSMFSLVPMGRSDSEVDISGDERPQSSEPEKTEDFEENSEYNYEEAFLQNPDLFSATSVLDLMKIDTEEGPEKLIKPLEEIPSMSFGLGRPTTRTHQKVLDMKTLLLRQEEEMTPNMENFGNLQEHAVKIQHESIASQWTQIRLRFSSRAQTKKGQTNVTCDAGILGSVQRQKSTFLQKLAEPLGNTITRENVGSYLHDLWHEPGFQTHTTQLNYAPETPGYEASEDEPIQPFHNPDMLSMARNAMLTRT